MDKKGEPKHGAQTQKALEICKDIKQQMKDFYKYESKSQLDFQNMIKDRGFSFLNSDVEERQTIVELCHAGEFVQNYLTSLKAILSAKLYGAIQIFFKGYTKARIDKFKKMEIIFSTNTTSNACFIGAYYKRGKEQLYLCYKVVKNAFKLAPDIYVIHQTESQSVAWGAFSSNSKRDVLQEMNRGFKKEDLIVLMEIASISLLDLSIINELQ